MSRVKGRERGFVAIGLSNERVIVGMLLESEEPYNMVDRFSNSFRGYGTSGIAFIPIKPASFLTVGFAYRIDSPRCDEYRRYIASWKRAFTAARRKSGAKS